MFNVVRKELDWAGRKLVLETGKVARQADGAVVASYGDTVVLCTAVSAKAPKDGVDFFPMTVQYDEKTYSAGKIPGGFFKREGRPPEKGILVSRLIDRPIRPLFPEGFYNETQIVCTVISYDPETDSDIIAMIGASAALAISGVPFEGPIGAAKVGYKNGEYILNPSPEQIKESELELVVAGTDTSVLMVESEAKILSEEIMLGAVEFGHKEMQSVIKLIKELKKEAGKPAWEVNIPDNSALYSKIKSFGEVALRDAYKETQKQTRVEKISAAKDAVIESVKAELGEENYNAITVKGLLKKLEMDIVRGDILKTKKRIDGRGEKDIRNIVAEVGLLPRTHGSALFTRGETQGLVVTTLGTADDMQIIDDLAGEYKQGFMLHYNFPPYSVGEATPMRAPGRREIGHGKLAWRALSPVLPDQKDFPYTIRVVSEITESNGSSSMATVCGGALSMMDAGVPLKAPVAGIAMGLILEGKEFSVLSDILGDEDHLGDMDFKVAGTKDGVTALQMDIKINGITTEIMKVALEQAKEGRQHILGKMAEALPEARSGLNKNAPQIRSTKISKSKIGELIGPGGKNIREICETTGAKIDIEEDGTVNISAVNLEAIEKALQIVDAIGVEIEAGQIFDGKVTKLMDFGAVVSFLGKNEGLVHISEIKAERVEDINEVLKLDDLVKVKVISYDRGKARLSMKRVDQNTGEDLSANFPDDGSRPSRGRNDRNDRGDRGGRGDRRGGGRRDFEDRGERSERRPRRDEDEDNRGNRAPEQDNSEEDKPKKKRRFF